MTALYLLYGVASLLPWNAYLKAIPQFQQMASSLSWSDSVPSLILTAFTGANLLTSLLAVALLSCNAKMLMPSVRTTVHGGLVVHALLLLGTIACCSIAPSMFILLPLILAAGVTSAIHQKALYTLLAPTPAAAPWFQAGQAVAGLASSVTAVVLGCAEAGQGSTTTAANTGISTASLFFGGSIVVLLVTLLVSLVYGKQIRWPAAENRSEQKGDQSMRHMWPLIASLWGCLSFTMFALRLLLLAKSASGIRLFTQWVFVAYDVGDLLGKLLPVIQTLCLRSSAPIIAFPFVRILLFLPPLLLTNTGGGSSPVQSDAVFYTLVLLFAVSNGYACTMLVMHALDYHRKNYKPSAIIAADKPSDGSVGTVVLLAINAGLATGSATSAFVPLMVRAVYDGHS